MGQLTSHLGLNWVEGPGSVAHLRARDPATGAVQERFGFDVGQPDPHPPVHPLHRDLGLGRVERILALPSLAQVSLAVAAFGERWCLALDGREGLRVRLWSNQAPARVRWSVVTASGEHALSTGEELLLDDAVVRRRSNVSSPVADLSDDEAWRQVVWGNAVRAPGGELYLPVSRAWISLFGRMVGAGDDFAGPLTFIWDAAFGSILAAELDLDLAVSNLRLLCRQIEADGMFRQLRVGERVNNLTGLPVASLALWRLYQVTSTPDLVAELFDPLYAANRWLRRHRDKNGDGLLEWGWEETGRGLTIPGPYGAWYESGLDDSPMWEEEPVDLGRRCFAASAVCINSLYAYDCLLLGRMARLLHRQAEAEALLAEHARMGAAINTHLWDEARGLYANRRWDGSFSPELSPTSFFPLLAEVVPEARVPRLLAHLEDERSFGGAFRLPSIARSSRHFTAAGDYWRGRIWPPLNLLTLLGVAKVDPGAAERLAADCRRLFFDEWRAHGHIHENYAADTGRGEPPAGVYARSCPFYTWGGLLLLAERVIASRPGLW